mmetsp:Transcript_10469/g.18471  ORF Transcript_10469/g.18471 Transcript_10469/m.18471 type:complete len:244 (-) Transcript_10469:533-1264(-)
MRSNCSRSRRSRQLWSLLMSIATNSDSSTFSASGVPPVSSRTAVTNGLLSPSEDFSSSSCCSFAEDASCCAATFLSFSDLRISKTCFNNSARSFSAISGVRSSPTLSLRAAWPISSPTSNLAEERSLFSSSDTLLDTDSGTLRDPRRDLRRFSAEFASYALRFTASTPRESPAFATKSTPSKMSAPSAHDPARVSRPKPSSNAPNTFTMYCLSVRSNADLSALVTSRRSTLPSYSPKSSSSDR